jgi:hypothetical protein
VGAAAAAAAGLSSGGGHGRGIDAAGAAGGNWGWPAWQESLFQTALTLHSHKDPCAIARLLRPPGKAAANAGAQTGGQAPGITCATVAARLKAMGLDSDAAQPEDEGGEAAGRPKRSNSRKVSRSSPPSLLAHLRAHGMQ